MFVLLLLFGLGFGASYYQLPAAIPGSYPIAMDPLSSSMVVNNGNNFSYFVRNIRSWSFNRSFVSGQSVALEGDLVAIGGTNVLSLYNLSFAADPVWSMNASCVGLLITDSVVFCGECSYEASAKCAVSIFVQESGNSWRLFDTLQRPDTKTQRFGMVITGNACGLVFLFFFSNMLSKKKDSCWRKERFTCWGYLLGRIGPRLYLCV